MKRKWGFKKSDIPELPYFSPKAKNEVPILTIGLPDSYVASGFQRTFDELWDAVVPPRGLRKWRWDGLDSSPERLRLSDESLYCEGIYWVAFDPDGHPEHEIRKHHSVVATKEYSKIVTTGNPDIGKLGLPPSIFLASSECLVATILYPKWLKKRGIVKISGYQFGAEGREWQNTPSLLYREQKECSGIELSVYTSSPETNSPTVSLI